MAGDVTQKIAHLLNKRAQVQTPIPKKCFVILKIIKLAVKIQLSRKVSMSMK
jgi:hypothetical protein